MAEFTKFPPEEALNDARGSEWNEYAAGTNAGATASKAAVTGVTHKIKWVQFWSDKDSLIQILIGSAGATVEWEGFIDIDVSGPNYQFIFPTALIGDVGIKVEAKIAASTSNCHVSFGGHSTISMPKL